jgi:phosphatidylglycerol---prolipoprotein diacylglyceryl transferase
MALTFPNIDPVALSLGPFQIRWYALAYLAGFLLGWYYARRLIMKDEGKGLRPTLLDIDDYLPFAVLGVILGGRIGYILFYQAGHYLSHPLEILQVWNGGMSFHGGVLGVIISIIAYAKIKQIPVLRLGDLFAVCCTFGLFFGRMANFINGELFGRVTNVPWAMVFPDGGAEPRHPSQIYEALLEGVVLFLVLRFLINKESIRSKPGIVAGAFLIGYGLIRIFIEFFREPDWHLGFVVSSFSMGQILCLPMIAVGAGLIYLANKNARTNAPV